MTSDRRSYRRVRASVLVRPVSVLARAVPQRVNDISEGGLRVYSDEAYVPGTRFEAELLFDDHESATSLAEVVWVEELPARAPARFDIGIRFIDVSPDGLERLRAVLEAS